MNKLDYIFTGVTMIFYILLSFVIHDFIKISGQIIGYHLVFSTSSLEILILSIIPFSSYFLCDRKFHIKQFLFNLAIFFSIAFLTLLILIFIASKIDIQNPLIPENILFIPHKNYFAFTFFLSLILGFSIIKIKNEYSKKLK